MSAAGRPTGGPAPAPALTIVVPCYNEEAGAAHLEAVLTALCERLGERLRLAFVLVDDGSTDRTFAELSARFGADARFRLVRHARNRGVAAAILTGIAAAGDEVVASIDSDCSYDPHALVEMLPLLAPDVALVTASPYHPQGRVEGVPGWRRSLSRGASRLYRMVLRNKIATYTSCFRLHRRSALAGIRLRHEGFTGVAEILARLDLHGWRVVEHPAVLGTRRHGHSKLKLARTIAGHLSLIAELAFAPRAERLQRVRPMTEG